MVGLTDRLNMKSRGEKKNGLRELTRNLAEFSPRKFAFENFCKRSEREKKELFSLADLYLKELFWQCLWHLPCSYAFDKHMQFDVIGSLTN